MIKQSSFSECVLKEACALSLLYTVRSVDLWVVGCGQNIYYVCSGRC